MKIFFWFCDVWTKNQCHGNPYHLKAIKEVSNNHHTCTCNHHFVWKKGKCVLLMVKESLRIQGYGDGHHEYCYNFNVCVFFLHQNSQASNYFYKVIYII